MSDTGLHMPHIGMRKIKTLLSVFIGFWLWQGIRLFFPGLERHPIFIYIYGIIEIRDSSEKTKDFGKARIKATFTALCIGLPLLALSELVIGHFSAQWLRIAIELAIMLFGVLVTLVIAEKVGCKVFCGLAAAIFLIIFISHNDEDRYVYSVLRALQTILGVFVAWLVNVVLFPYPGKKKSKWSL